MKRLLTLLCFFVYFFIAGLFVASISTLFDVLFRGLYFRMDLFLVYAFRSGIILSAVGTVLIIAIYLPYFRRR